MASIPLAKQRGAPDRRAPVRGRADGAEDRRAPGPGRDCRPRCPCSYGTSDHSSGESRFCDRTCVRGPSRDLDRPPGRGSYCPAGVPCSEVALGRSNLPACARSRRRGQTSAERPGGHAGAWLPVATVSGALPGRYSSREETAGSLRAQRALRGQAFPPAFTPAQDCVRPAPQTEPQTGSSRVALPPLENELVCARLLDTSVTLRETRMTVTAVV